MLSFVLAIVSLGVLIIIHEAGHFLVARLCGMRVDRFSIGFGPALGSFKRGETVYQIGWIPLGGFVQIAGLNPNDEGILADDPRSYPRRPVWQRLATIAAGPGTNYLFAALMMAGVYMAWGEPREGKLPLVGDVVDGKPAAKAGLQVGDEVISIDGQVVKHMNDVSRIIEQAEGRAVKIEVVRGGSGKSYTIQPEKSEGRWRIGIVIWPRKEFVAVPIGRAFIDGLVFPVRTTPIILESIGQMISGRQKVELAGPVGMVSQLRGELKHGPADGLWFIASISVALGLFNLLPLPALDGGRLIFLGYEGISRRKFPQLLEQRIHMVGILALLGLLLIITVFDIGRLIH